MDSLAITLRRIEQCVAHGTYEAVDADWLELKPVPPSGGAWDKIRESICAFLNARGGTVLLGIKDEQKPQRHFTFTGYTEAHSGNVAAFRPSFHTSPRHPCAFDDCLPV